MPKEREGGATVTRTRSSVFQWFRSLLTPHRPPFPMLAAGVRYEPLAELQIARLMMKPGDILVVRAKKRLPREAILRLKHEIERDLRGARCFVLDSELDLAVIENADLSARLAQIEADDLSELLRKAERK